MEIRVARTMEEFEALSGQWDRLLEQSRAKSLFLTWEWQFSWWKHLREDRQLHILLAYERTLHRLVGIAPLCIERRDLFKCISLRCVTFIGSGRVGADFLDFIITPGLERQVVEAFYRHLSDHRSGWDAVELRDIAAAARTVKLWTKAADAGDAVLSVEAAECPYIRLEGSYERFLAKLARRTRMDLQRKERRLLQQQGMSITINDAGIENRVETLFALHREGFSVKQYGRDRESDFSGSAIMAFHRDLLPALLRNNWLRLYSLKHRDRIIAFLYAFRYKKNLYCYQSGFSREWLRMSPGTVLFGRCIRDSVAEGCTEFHYLRGKEEYKRRWTGTARRTIHLVLVNRSCKGLLYRGWLVAKKGARNVLRSRKRNDNAYITT